MNCFYTPVSLVDSRVHNVFLYMLGHLSTLQVVHTILHSHQGIYY
eukprot:XP_001703887.1 Hypothetical protein GL50803_115385 [Giardia lamblia ATCC 50803]